MKQKNNLLGWFGLLAVLVVTLVVLLVLLTTIPGPGTYTGPANLTAALAEQRSLLLESGKTASLNINETLLEEGVTFTSSDPKVATVDASGVVTAVGKGSALITVADPDETILCGVIVDGQGSMIDVTGMSAKVLFSDIMLHAQTEIQGMAVDTVNNAVYLSQGYGASAYVPLNSDIMISKVALVDGVWQRDSWMRFSGSGKGSMAMDIVDNKPCLWLESGGDFIGYGKTVSVVEWEDYGYGLDSYGQTFEPVGSVGSVTVSADPENNLVMVYDRNEKCYLLYDREDILAGNTEPEYLHKIECVANQTPENGRDDSKGRYNASIRGYVLHDGYIYQLSGSTSIYLSVFDLEGDLQYCHRIEDHPDLETRLPASIAVADGKIYIAIASGSSACYFANVWVFE